jgi:hypothetical protein
MLSMSHVSRTLSCLLRMFVNLLAPGCEQEYRCYMHDSKYFTFDSSINGMCFRCLYYYDASHMSNRSFFSIR